MICNRPRSCSCSCRMARHLHRPLGKTVVARQALERPSLSHLSRPAGYRTSSLVSLVQRLMWSQSWFARQFLAATSRWTGICSGKKKKKKRKKWIFFYHTVCLHLLFNNVKIAKSRLHSNNWPLWNICVMGFTFLENSQENYLDTFLMLSTLFSPPLLI